MPNSITPFRKNKKPLDLRRQLNGLEILNTLNKNLKALEKIDDELEDSIQDFERNVTDENGEVIRTEFYRSTILDKETIAVYHTRQAGHKMQIDTALKMLNKVMPDLKAIEHSDNLKDASTKALEAFAIAAAEIPHAE